jgi:AraC-like DNA-binding protein
VDPLEDVLALLDATSSLSTSLAAGGSWAIRFGPQDGVKFTAVRRGRCHLKVEGQAAPYDLDEGDCFLLTQPRPFTLFSDPAAVPVAAEPIFLAAVDGVAHAGAGEDVFMIGGAFSFGERAHTLLLDDLPPVVHIPAATEEAAGVRWAISRIDSELRQRQLGSTLVTEHLALVMLIQVLRLHLTRHAPRTSGWLAGTADPVIAAALRRLHLRPAHPWTVDELAQAAGVSRSTLAARFKNTVGLSPLEYLTGWRIELAADRLRRGDDTLAAIARDVGYGSESAFSVAFKRVIGVSPGTYRRKAAPVRVSG